VKDNAVLYGHFTMSSSRIHARSALPSKGDFLQPAGEGGHPPSKRFGRTKAYELIEAGKIDAYKMGHQTMIDLNSVDRYHASLPKLASAS
jgi:hypothetical protein